MKKLFLALAMLLLIVVAACGGAPVATDTLPETVATEAPAEEAAAEEPAATEEAAAEAPVATEEAAAEAPAATEEAAAEAPADEAAADEAAAEASEVIGTGIVVEVRNADTVTPQSGDAVSGGYEQNPFGYPDLGIAAGGSNFTSVTQTGNNAEAIIWWQVEDKALSEALSSGAYQSSAVVSGVSVPSAELLPGDTVTINVQDTDDGGRDFTFNIYRDDSSTGAFSFTVPALAAEEAAAEAPAAEAAAEASEVIGTGIVVEVRNADSVTPQSGDAVSGGYELNPFGYPDLGIAAGGSNFTSVTQTGNNAKAFIWWKVEDKALSEALSSGAYQSGAVVSGVSVPSAELLPGDTVTINVQDTDDGGRDFTFNIYRDDSSTGAFSFTVPAPAAEEAAAPIVDTTVGEGIVIGVNKPGDAAFDALTPQFGDLVWTGEYAPISDDVEVGTLAGETYNLLMITQPDNNQAQAFIVWSVEDEAVTAALRAIESEIGGLSDPSPALMRGDTITIQVQPRGTLDANAPEGSLDVTFSIFRDGTSIGLFSFVTGGE